MFHFNFTQMINTPFSEKFHESDHTILTICGHFVKKNFPMLFLLQKKHGNQEKELR